MGSHARRSVIQFALGGLAVAALLLAVGQLPLNPSELGGATAKAQQPVALAGQAMVEGRISSLSTVAMSGRSAP